MATSHLEKAEIQGLGHFTMLAGESNFKGKKLTLKSVINQMGKVPEQN